jgi:predicted flap endonuclease-1-like 5' DNA nuclease
MVDDQVPETIPSPDWAAVADGVDLPYQRYEKATERIGVGANAIVHEASVDIDGETHRVALKEPKLPSGTVDRTALEAISSEAETWNRVTGHPHIVDVLDWGVQFEPWIAAEYMNGGTLADRQSEVGIGQALWIGEQLADALYHAVRMSTAHLDLTPRNVLFLRTPDDVWDVPKIADWGVARELVARTETVEVLTPQYAAPEQFDPDAFQSPDERTDISQLGAILYELLTDRPPFEGSTQTVKHKVLNESPTPPSAHKSTLPEGTDEVLQTALAIEPDDRFDSPFLLREELAALRQADPNPTPKRAKTATPDERPSTPTLLSEPTTGEQRGIETIAGLGETYADRLQPAGVETVRDLAVTDPGTLLAAADTGPKRIARWIAHARSQAAVDPIWLVDDQADDSAPVTVIDGIGETYASALGRARVETVADLAVAGPRRIAESAELPVHTVIEWISAARSRVGVKTTPELAVAHSGSAEDKQTGRANTDHEKVEFDVAEPEPVTEISGIGPVTSRDLGKAGILTIRELADADVETLATELSTGKQRVRTWVADAKDVAGPPVDTVSGVNAEVSERLASRGIESAQQLADCDPGEVAQFLGVSETNAAALIERAEETTYEMVSDIRGVGPTFADRLREQGVTTPADLVQLDAETIARIAETDTGRAKRWQRRANQPD